MNHNSAPILAGIDTGGTFTDLVVIDRGRLRQLKVLSSPDDPSRAIAQGLKELGLDETDIQVVHGTTVGTNAVLEGKGARVAYLTSTGFADVLSLGRQNREHVYQLEQPAMAPPVDRSLCFEVSTRMLADGSVLERATDEELDRLLTRLESSGARAVAINLLFSFLAPQEEARIAERIGSRAFVSCSSNVLPEPREYERGIATWLDASVAPLIGTYIEALEHRLPQARISVMQSSGTTVSAAQAPRRAVHLLLSGPAGGMAAAKLMGQVSGQQRLLTFDMGGTSTDVSLLDGDIPISSNNHIGRWPVGVPSVDIHTIGAGGGSIARVDEAGMLLVGPESAGASPGPACYGFGATSATVTDANLVLGRIPPDTLLGGTMPLDQAAAQRALDRLANDLGCDRDTAAHGVVRLANEHMARALRVISVERGHDPREYALLSFGGAGGLHACDLAELLGIRRIILPAAGGVLCALGMLASEPGRVQVRSILRDAAVVTDDDIDAAFTVMEENAAEELSAEGVDAQSLDCQRDMELRYHGQSSTIVIPFCRGNDHVQAFHQSHEASAGHRLQQTVELVKLRSIVSGSAPLKDLAAIEATPEEGEQCDRGQGSNGVLVIERDELSVGESLQGPAVIREPVATMWLSEAWSATPDKFGNLHLQRD